MVLTEGVRSAVARLRLAAADVAARGAQSQPIIGSALLAHLAAGRRDDVGGVGAEAVIWSMRKIHGGQRTPCENRAGGCAWRSSDPTRSSPSSAA